jgi:hypothetical protein
LGRLTDQHSESGGVSTIFDFWWLTAPRKFDWNVLIGARHESLTAIVEGIHASASSNLPHHQEHPLPTDPLHAGHEHPWTFAPA